MNPYESPQNVERSLLSTTSFMKRRKLWLLAYFAIPWVILIICRLTNAKESLFQEQFVAWSIISSMWWGQYRALKWSELAGTRIALTWLLLMGLNGYLVLLGWVLLEPHPNISGTPGGSGLEAIHMTIYVAIPLVLLCGIFFVGAFLVTLLLQAKRSLTDVNVTLATASSARYSLYPFIILMLPVAASSILNWIEAPTTTQWYWTPWGIVKVVSVFCLWQELLQPRIRIFVLVMIVVVLTVTQQLTLHEFHHRNRLRFGHNDNAMWLMLTYSLMVFGTGLGGRWVGWRIVPRVAYLPHDG